MRVEAWHVIVLELDGAGFGAQLLAFDEVASAAETFRDLWWFVDNLGFSAWVDRAMLSARTYLNQGLLDNIVWWVFLYIHANQARGLCSFSLFRYLPFPINMINPPFNIPLESNLIQYLHFITLRQRVLAIVELTAFLFG